MHIDFTGAKLLVALILVILIVFAGSVPTAQRSILDTWYGRLIAAVIVLLVARQAGLWLGIMAAVTVLVLMPQSMREGFMNSDSFRGSIMETGNQQMNVNFKDYADEDDERLSSIEEPFMRQMKTEGFYNGADRKQKIPKERRKPWFIEKIMDEQPEVIETDTVSTQAAQ